MLFVCVMTVYPNRGHCHENGCHSPFHNGGRYRVVSARQRQGYGVVTVMVSDLGAVAAGSQSVPYSIDLH